MDVFFAASLLVLVAGAHAFAGRIAAVAILTGIHLNGVQGAVVLAVAMVAAAVYAAADAGVGLFLTHDFHFLSRVCSRTNSLCSLRRIMRKKLIGG